MAKQMSLIIACKDYFGLRPNQTAMDFMREFKELTDKDKSFFRDHLPSVGYEITSG